jgi:hypothetical protein
MLLLEWTAEGTKRAEVNVAALRGGGKKHGEPPLFPLATNHQNIPALPQPNHHNTSTLLISSRFRSDPATSSDL